MNEELGIVSLWGLGIFILKNVCTVFGTHLVSYLLCTGSSSVLSKAAGV